MKKIILAVFILSLSIYLASCGASRVTDLRALSLGMSKEQVVQTIGLADRTLAVNATEQGLQEVLEFRTYYNEVYAVEFIDNQLVGYEFLYDDSPTIVPGTVVPMYPVSVNRPIYHVQPNRPTQPNRPSRPSNNRPSRPSESNRPVQPSRPSGNVGTTRPVDKPIESVRPSTRPSTRESN